MANASVYERRCNAQLSSLISSIQLEVDDNKILKMKEISSNFVYSNLD